MSTKDQVNFFKIQATGHKEHLTLNILSLLQSGKALSIEGISKETGANKDEVANLINELIKKELLAVSGGDSGEVVKFNSGFKNVVGIGFCGGECTVTLMDLEGNVKEKEHFTIDLFKSWKGRNREVVGIAEEIGKKTGFTEKDIYCVGIAISQEMIAKNPKTEEILAKGIKKIFRSKVFMAKEATAAGYAEKNLNSNLIGKDIIYLHSDIGLGVVVKGESIFEADGKNGSSLYLQSWPQYRIVDNAKALVEKGIGTDIVAIANGDVDNISLGAILEAAEKNDELAEDLVRRAALALGVRAAYLANMFNPDAVILGGGIESGKGKFVQHVQESVQRFVLEKFKNKLMVIPSKLGVENSSIGAALLCRRELFMEV